MILKALTKDSVRFENLKIGSLQAVILLFKFHPKQENHTSVKD